MREYSRKRPRDLNELARFIVQLGRLIRRLLLALALPIAGLSCGSRGSPGQARATEDLRLTGNGKIAFVSERDGNQEVYVADPDGTDLTRLTTDPAVDNFPVWSPDGRRLAFFSDRSGNGDIYVVNFDGTGVTRLTDSSEEESQPAWSPDGASIAFARLTPSGLPQVFVMKADGTEVRQLTDAPEGALHPTWSPDSSQIAFSTSATAVSSSVGGAVFVVGADGSGLRRVFAAEGNQWVILRAGSWSPDGKSILFTLAYLPLSEDEQPTDDIFATDPAGTELTRLTADGGSAGGSWSPDGTEIVFDRWLSLDEDPDIYVMDADGSRGTRLTDDPAHDGDPSWQPVAV